MIHAWTNELAQIFHTRGHFLSGISVFLETVAGKTFSFPSLSQYSLTSFHTVYGRCREQCSTSPHTWCTTTECRALLMVRRPQALRTLHLAATDHLRYRVLEQYIRCHCMNGCTQNTPAWAHIWKHIAPFTACMICMEANIDNCHSIL